MKSLRYAKLGAVFALALGAAVPASLIVATPAAAHEQHRDNDRGGFHADYRGGANHRGFDANHHSYRGHWEMRNHRWQWFDGFWFGR